MVVQNTSVRWFLRDIYQRRSASFVVLYRSMNES
jgi:hypothetical protein